MCAHACSFHKKKGSHVTPCCVPCSCGQNVELTKYDAHRATCHRVGIDVPKLPVMTIRPSASTSVPAHQ